MNSTLEKHFARLEQSKNEILTLIATLTEHEFHQSIHGKWSVGQILIHIVTSERLALEYMKKKSLGIAHAGTSGLIEPLKLTLLQLSQRLPIKYKVPKVIREKTPDAPSKQELIEMWNRERQNLRNFLESIPDNYVNKKIFKHPIAGMFNPSQGIVFLRAHLLHHRPQVVRISSSFKPQASQQVA
ncbi:MAG TPA: DinB family protein [Chryseosolibacter sp.]